MKTDDPSRTESDPVIDRRRVLEIGEVGLFHWAMPDRTDAYYASYRADLRKGRPYLGLRALVRILGSVLRGESPLVVVHPPFYPGWHPRSFLAAFKFSVLRGRPRELYGAIVSPLVFELIRFVPLRPLIGIDRSDSTTIPRHHFFLLDRAEAYYKRELPADHWLAFQGTGHRRLPGASFRRSRRWRRRIARLRPIALGLDGEQVAAASAAFGAEKKTDVFFAGTVGANSTQRSEVPELIAQLEAAGVRVDVPNEAMPHAQFVRRCAEAWIVLSPAGLGWECYRHVEAALAGSVPLVSAPTIHRYRPLVVGTHCLSYFPDEGRIVEIVKDALADKARLAEMAAAAHDHALKYLTDEAICRELAGMHAGADSPPRARQGY